MRNVMGIINTAEKKEAMEPLTKIRSLASVPFGSRYRLVDFPLSNLVNSGLTNIGILLEEKYRSLLDHIGPGKAWELDRKRGGLYFLPSAKVYKRDGIYKGDIENFKCNIDYLHRCNENYVIISTPNLVCNLNYEKVFSFHQNRDADITLIYKEHPTVEEKNHTVLETDENERIIELKDAPNMASASYNKIFLDKLLIKKDFLIEIIDECASTGKWDFIKDGIINNIYNYDIYGYPFEGVVGTVNTINNYFNFNLELLEPKVRKNLFHKENIYTKPKDEPPCKITSEAETRNSILGNGSIIQGYVENSILFREVRINKGAKIKNSILFQGAEVEEGVEIENVILDKNAKISSGKKMRGEVNKPIVIEKNEVV